MMTSGVGTVAEEDHDAGETVEFDTYMRERPVQCRWRAGELTGDAELLARLEHMVLSPDWRRSPASVARAISAAVAHPVTIRVLLVDDPASAQEDPAPSQRSGTAAPDVLGDYWLG